MHIAIDASRANRRQKTGVEWYAYHIILELINQTHHTGDMLTLYFQDEPDDVFQGHKHVECKILKWPPKFLWTHIRLLLELRSDRPDLLFIPAHVPPFLYVGKQVVMLHDIAFKRFPGVFSRFSQWYQDLSVRTILRDAHILTPSIFTRDEILDVYGDIPHGATVVPHGFNISHKEIQMEGVTKPYFLFVGRIEHKKNLVRLIQAFDIFKKQAELPHKLILVGKDGFGADKVLDAINHAEYKDDIIRKNWVNQSELDVLYAGASAFTFPTVYEGFGLPILEAMQRGIPVLTSNMGAAAEVAGDAALLVDPSDVDAIANAMQQILQDRDQLIALGRERSQAYSWQKAGRETYDAIKIWYEAVE